MRGSLTAAFVVTAACSGGPPPRAQPVVPVESPDGAEPADPVPTAAPTTPKPTIAKPTGGEANPVDAEGRTIMLSYNLDDKCFVYLPYPPLKPGEQRYPGTPPPSVDVPCPPEMKSPAFKTCRGGTISYKDEGCECFEMGNPPRVEPNACP